VLLVLERMVPEREMQIQGFIRAVLAEKFVDIS
jgi:hypothetical protein